MSAPSDGSLAEVTGRWEATTTVPGLGELSFSVNITAAGTDLSGTMDIQGNVGLPLGAGPHPAVVLINGSGPQDRDSTVAGFSLFAELAEHPAELGIASLRWDDRGVGGSSGSDAQATLEDRAGDAEAALGLLESRSDVGSRRIGLVGASEGGWIAPIVANRSDSVAFVVLLAGVAVPGDEILRAQLLRILTVAGVPTDEIAREQAHQELALQAVKTGEGWDEVELSYRQLARRQLDDLSDDARESIPDEEYFIKTVVQDELRTLQSPWFSSLVQYDPRPDLIELRVPVLALFGELDTQVPLDLNMAALSEALSASDAPSHTIETIAQASHLFQTAVTGSPDEYSKLTPAFAPDFLQQLSDWLTPQVSS